MIRGRVNAAQIYSGGRCAGSTIAKGGALRGKLFITAEVRPSNAGYEKAAVSIGESDKAGRLRVIGVPNFCPARRLDLCRFVEITPAVHQVKLPVTGKSTSTENGEAAGGADAKTEGEMAERTGGPL